MRKTIGNLGIIRKSTLEQLETQNLFHAVVRWGFKSTKKHSIQRFVLDNITDSFAQLQQDLIAVYLTNRIFGKNILGYFVEFGATDGIKLSNTFILEKYYDWNGLLCEPSAEYFPKLQKNRNVSTDNRCVFATSGDELLFVEQAIGEHSSISGYSRNGKSNSSDNEKHRYKVESVSLRDLLITHNAPGLIHFLSIDTEGSEYEILRSFDFSEYQFVFICVELSQNVNQIHQVMTANDFHRILPEYSRWDGWYVHKKFLPSIQDLM